MDTTKDRFEYGAKVLLMLVVVMIPLWFLPLPVALEFGREVSFSLCIIAASILWLLSLLTRGEMKFPSSLIMWAAGLMIIAFGASAMLSQTPLVSLVFGNPLSEKFSSLLLGILLMLVTSSVCSKHGDIKRIVFLLIGASGIAGFIAFFQLAWGISLFGRLSSYAQGNMFNVVGTMNGFALFLVTMFVVALGFLFSSSAAEIKSKIRYAITAILVILMLDLMMIHFYTAWIVLLGSLIFFSGLMFMYMGGRKREKGEQQGSARGFDWRYSMLILLIALSVVMLVVKTPIFGSANLPAEVSPSFTATLSVGQRVLQEGPRAFFFGSGPTTFNLNWAKYRAAAINETQFWNVSFVQGFSWITTMMPTVGGFGIFTFLLFLCLALVIFLRHILKFPHEQHTPIATSVFLGFIAMIFIAILYPTSLTFVLMLFLFVGILMSLIARSEPELLPSPDEQDKAVHLAFEHTQIQGVDQELRSIHGRIETNSDRPGWWDITSKTFRFESSWFVFVSSLLAIFFVSLGVAAMYLEIGRLRAALVSQRAVVMFNKGEIDGAIAGFEKAALFEDKNFANYIPIVQARMEKIRALIQQATAGNNVQQEFQNAASLAIQNSQTAINLNPADPTLWRLQGSLYELFIPFIPGSENFAFSSYRKAIELDPLNPSFDIDLARAGLVAVDRLTLTIQQSSAGERDKLTQVRISALEEIMKVLQKAVDIKPDLADSHFLATQAALRLGNVSVAIASAEKAKLAAPFEIGIAFQLGVLYYQSGDIDKAQIEFERSVAMNNNYSNARYFLGLIYDRKGDKPRAIQQFEQIEALNPTNQEVKNILENLRASKSALAGIVPPAAPPEKRNVTPVIEEKVMENK